MSNDKIEARDPGHAQGHAGGDVIIPGLAVALTLYYLGSTGSLTWEARSTGWLISFVLLALCSVQLILLFVRRFCGKVTLGLGELVENTQNNRRRLGLLIILSTFVASIRFTGATLGIFLVMVLSMLVMGVRRPAHLIGIAGATATCVFLLFMVVLKSRLPQGALDQFLLFALTGRGD